MKDFINRIKQFFKNIISKNKIKQLEEPKERMLIEYEDKTNQKQEEKKQFFEIYNKIKNNEYNLRDLTTDQAEKTVAMLKSEINLKKNKLSNDITELNILKADNRIEEKNRIFELYNGIKEQTIDLNNIDREDLLKIRKLFIEEAKIQDKKLEDEITLLELMKKIS